MERIVYGLCGFIGSGKDAACQALCDHSNATKFSFAGILKDVVSTVFSWDRDMLDGITPESRKWREQVDSHWTRALGFDVTPRQVLQRMGTEVFRSYHKDIWIKAVERRLQLSSAPVAVFTDARFGNEMEFIKQQNGCILWVYRPASGKLPQHLQTQVDSKDLLSLTAAAELSQLGLHASETSFLTEGANQINIVLINDGTLDDMNECVKHAHDVVTCDQSIVPIHSPNTTVYLDKHLGTFRWQWRDEDGGLRNFLLPEVSEPACHVPA
jgi:hypothetical protein